MKIYNILVDDKIIKSGLEVDTVYAHAEKEVKRLRRAGFTSLADTVRVEFKNIETAVANLSYKKNV